MGMSYEQYWEGDPRLAVAYREAYRLRREMDNEQAWLQGFYMHYGFSVSLANAFSKRGAKKETYIEQPIDIFPLTEEEKKRREEKETRKMQEAMRQMIRKQQRNKTKG